MVSRRHSPSLLDPMHEDDIVLGTTRPLDTVRNEGPPAMTYPTLAELSRDTDIPSTPASSRSCLVIRGTYRPCVTIGTLKSISTSVENIKRAWGAHGTPR